MNEFFLTISASAVNISSEKTGITLIRLGQKLANELCRLCFSDCLLLANLAYLGIREGDRLLPLLQR
jgi:hypothetical protein